MKQVKSILLSLSKKQEIVILSVLVVVLGFWVFGPILSKLRSRLLIKRTLTKEVVLLENKASLLAGIEPMLINERVLKMEEVFPSRKPVVELLGTLSTLSANRSLIFGGVSLNPGKLNEEIKFSKSKTSKDAQLGDLSFGFQIEGSFGDVLGFLKDLENVAPLMKIDEVSLSIKTNPLFDTQNTIVSADVQVSAFYQSPPKTLGAISTPVKLLTRKDEVVLNKLINFTTFRSVIPVAQTGKINLFE